MLILVLGCKAYTEPATAPLGVNGIEVKIQTDQRAYSFSSDSRVHVSMANVGTEPVYAPLPSFFVRLEIQRERDWQALGAWYGILAVAPRVVPFLTGDTLPADLPLTSSVLRSPGVYRFVYEVYEDSELSRLLPRRLLLSNAFEIVE
ncbi:MAG: hypothetical protein ACREMW_00890 [Gemmatimonadales bacterium]